MVESRTARMRLVQWSEGTDSPQRVDFNETFNNIETLALIFERGRFSDRPNPTKKGCFYDATDQGILYYSDGVTWTVVGANVTSQYTKAGNSNSPAFVAQGTDGQAADLMRITLSNQTLVYKLRNNGDMIVGPLSVLQAAKTTSSDNVIAPTDSAVQVASDKAVWGLTVTMGGNGPLGLFRLVKGGSTVFAVDADGSATASIAPTQPEGVARLKEVTDLKTSIESKSISPGNGLNGGGRLNGASVTLSADYAGSGGYYGTASSLARSDHSHSLKSLDATGFYPKPMTIVGSTNPNAVINAGVYNFYSVTAQENWPVQGAWGVLEVLVSGASSVQRFTSTSTGAVWMRYGNGTSGGFSQWRIVSGPQIVPGNHINGWSLSCELGGFELLNDDRGDNIARIDCRLVRASEAFNHDRDWYAHGIFLPPQVRRRNGVGSQMYYTSGAIENIPCLVRIDLWGGGIETNTLPSKPTVYPGGAIYIRGSWWI